MKKLFSIFMVLIVSVIFSGNMMYGQDPTPAQNPNDPSMTADQAKKSVDVLLSMYNDLIAKNASLQQQLDVANQQIASLQSTLGTTQDIMSYTLGVLRSIQDTVLTPLGSMLGSLGDLKVLGDQIIGIQNRAAEISVPSNMGAAKKIVVIPNKNKDADKKKDVDSKATPSK